MIREAMFLIAITVLLLAGAVVGLIEEIIYRRRIKDHDRDVEVFTQAAADALFAADEMMAHGAKPVTTKRGRGIRHKVIEQIGIIETQPTPTIQLPERKDGAVL